MDRPQSHWFYKRVHATKLYETLFFELPGGLAFLCRRFHFIQPEFVETAGPVFTQFPIIGFEFIDGTGAIKWQKDPIPPELYSAPRRDGVIVKTETAPYDLEGFGINMSATFKPRTNTINLFYDVGELVTIKMTGFENLPAPVGYIAPNYVDVAVEGVFIPDMPPNVERV